MRGKIWLWGIGLVGTLGGCDVDSGSGYAVGDHVDGGRVTDVRGEDCQAVTISFEPEWECSEDDLESLRTGGGPTAGEAPGPEVVDVGLVATDCEGLAALRRPAVKAQLHSELWNRYRAILLEKCIAKQTIR